MRDRAFHLFVYGTLVGGGEADGLLAGCERLGPATVAGTLYDIRGEYPALILYGDAPVRGEVWRCPNRLLPRLDDYESVSAGLFRRVAVDVDGVACWTYVAGPAIARELTPGQRVDGGAWKPAL